MVEPEGGDWMSLLLAGEEQPLSVLQLDGPSGAFDAGLFEPCSLGPDLPDLLLDGPELASPGRESANSHDSQTGAWSEQQLPASSQPMLPCPQPGPTLSQSSLQGWAGTGAAWPLPATHSQQHSDTGMAPATMPDMADSSGHSDGTEHTGPGQAAEPPEAEQKRQVRLQRNRENAQLSRQRKKQQVAGLEARCGELQAHNVQLGGLVSRLTAEVATLRFQLAAICQQVGRPVPHIPSALAPSMAAAANALPGMPLPPVGMPAAYQGCRLPPVSAGPCTAPMPVAYGATASKVAIPVYKPAPQQQRPQQAQTAAAATAADSSNKGRKRAKTAGSAFLALFTLFMFMGPFTAPPGATVMPQGIPHAISAPSLAALPADNSLAAAQPRTGRALLQADEPDDLLKQLDIDHQQLPALPAATKEDLPSTTALAVRDATAVPIADEADSDFGAAAAADGKEGMGQLAALWNTTRGALWPTREPLSGAQLEQLALQRLQELAPVALLLDADDLSALPSAAHPLAVSQAFPQLAGQLFASSGLLAPQTCHAVFELDATTLPAAERSRRSIERLLLGTLGMRGRSMLPVPAASAGATDEQQEGIAPEHKRLLAVAALPASDQQVPQQGGEEEEVQEWQEGGAWHPLQLDHPSPLRLGRSAGARLAATADGPSGEQEEGPGSSSSPALVSILVPAANASGEGMGGGAGGVLASVSKVFVVMLYPRQRYVTYACSL